jgi:hypothetical protein
MKHAIILRQSSRWRIWGRSIFFLGLQLDHLHMSILVHQSTYVQKVLEMFNMDKVYSARTPMIVRALEKETNSFRSKEEGEEVLDLNTHTEVSLVRWCNLQILLDPTFFIVNCLTRHSTAPTMCHWNDIKNILRYLVGTIYLGYSLKGIKYLV